MIKKKYTKSRSEYLNRLFTYLTKENISYCVVGDSEALPEDISSDIDIVINNETLSLIKHKIFQFSNENKCSLVQILQHEHNAYYFVLSWMNDKNKTKFIHPDICSDYYRRGKPLLLASDILKGRKLAVSSDNSKKSFYIPASEVEFIYYLMKKVDKGSVNQQQYEHLCEQYFQSPEKCNVWLHKYWSQNDVNTITQLILNKEFNKLQNSLSHLQNGLIDTRRPTVTDRLREFQRRVYRVLQPTGVIIAFLGPDGAGKTAIGDQLQSELAPAFRKLKHFHLRPGFVGKKKGKGIPVSDPHEKPPRGKIISIAKLLYFWVDYTLGYFFKVRPLKVRSTFIIFDRYFHDLLVDPRRYRYGAPMWMAKIVGWLIPKPDMFLILDAPAEVIHKRKQEVTIEETKRQREAYLKFAKMNVNCIILNTSGQLDETVSEACTMVLNYMKKRQQFRLRLK